MNLNTYSIHLYRLSVAGRGCPLIFANLILFALNFAHSFQLNTLSGSYRYYMAGIELHSGVL